MTALVNRLGCSLSSKQRTINPPHRLAGKAPTYVVPIRCQARKSPQNGSSKSKNAKQREVKDGLDNGNHRKESRLIDIVRYRYFEELFSAGDYSLAGSVLDDNVIHKDMVRDEVYNGIGEVCEYMRAVKEAWPEFFVRATDIAIAEDGTSLFAAFEGRAAEGMPLFKGVDRFIFSLDDQHSGEPLIKEVEVYRSNWKGAQGHAERKAARAASATTAQVEMRKKS